MPTPAPSSASARWAARSRSSRPSAGSRSWRRSIRRDGDAPSVSRETLGGCRGRDRVHDAGLRRRKHRRGPGALVARSWSARRGGTTGAPRSNGRRRSSRGAILIAPNFSVGVAVFDADRAGGGAGARDCAGVRRAPVETHHAAKKDAPSGTRRASRSVAAASSGARSRSRAFARAPCRERTNWSSTRPFEQIRLEHMRATGASSPMVRSWPRSGSSESRVFFR